MSVYSTKSNSKSESYSGNILDLVVESVENDQKMFDSVITLDFLEAYNEAGYHVVTEAEEEQTKENSVKAIIKKIPEIAKNAVDSIIKFIGDWVEKMIAIITKDKETYDKFVGSFNNNAKGYKTKYRKIKSDFVSGEVDFKAYSEEVKANIDVIKSGISLAESQDEINSIVKDTLEKSKSENVNELAASAIFDGDEKSDYVIDDDDMETIKKIMYDPKAVKSVASKCQKEVKKSTQGDVLRAAQDALGKLKEGGLDLAKANAVFRVVNALISKQSKYYSALVRYAGQAVSEARRVFIAAARVKKEADGKVSEETKQECALIEMASDIYMESALAMD